MGLNVSVFRATDGYDCTLNGISSKADYLCLVNVEGPSQPGPNALPAMLVKGNMPGLVKIVPATKQEDKWVAVKDWCMMGGNYAATSDSRFHRAVESIIGAQSSVPFLSTIASNAKSAPGIIQD